MWDAACPCACVFACVVCLCVCVLSSWHSSTNLSSIQIFHSDGKRPDSNSIVPLKCPFPFVDVHFYNKICHVLKGQMPGLGQMWDPVMIFTCQIVSNPRLRPRGGGSHVTMIGALLPIFIKKIWQMTQWHTYMNKLCAVEINFLS